MAAKVPLGIGLVGGGVFLMWGGFSGRLAPMLAAVFYPSQLTESTTGGSFPLFDIAPPSGGDLSPPGAGDGSAPIPAPGGGEIGSGTPEVGPGPVLDLGPGSILELVP